MVGMECSWRKDSCLRKARAGCLGERAAELVATTEFEGGLFWKDMVEEVSSSFR